MTKNQNQPIALNVKIEDIKIERCQYCGGSLMQSFTLIGRVSRLNPHNPTGQDQLTELPVLVCANCGTFYGEKEPRKDETFRGSHRPFIPISKIPS